MSNEATITYLKKDGKKSRLITTYKNNDLGRKLRDKHKVEINFINDYLKDDDLHFAYTKNKSTNMMVKKHVNSKHFLYIDIKSFFPSIDLKILKEKSKFLANKNLEEDKLNYLIDTCKIINSTGEQGLAIGLIPSAFFSNVYLNDFDKKMNNYLMELDGNFEYTRYSDDIVISNSNEFEKDKIMDVLIEELKSLKLEIHDSKTRKKSLSKPGDHIKILGLNIVRGNHGNYISVSRKFKKSMKKEKYYLAKNGKINYIKYNEYNK